MEGIEGKGVTREKIKSIKSRALCVTNVFPLI